MNMQIEKGGSFSYEFSPVELVVDTHDIYQRALNIIRLESLEEESSESASRLEELRRIKGYIGGYELDYRIEGFDFVRFEEGAGIQLLMFLSPPFEEKGPSLGLFTPGDVYSIFKYQLDMEEGVGDKFELKIHEFDDSGDEFVTEDRFYTLHPIVIPIWESYKIERLNGALKGSSNRELIELS